jgi:hypothetical protein
VVSGGQAMSTRISHLIWAREVSTVPRGEYERSDAKRAVESYDALDIRLVVRQPMTGTLVSLCWEGGFARRSSADMWFGATGVTLFWADPEGRTVVQNLEIEQTPQHFGGIRPWWICPDCGRRCAIVYGFADRFTCRQCGKLTYTTSQSSDWVRKIRKARKIEARLKILKIGDRRVPIRPKGMHQQTFHRLVDRWVAAELASGAAFKPVAEGWARERRRSESRILGEQATIPNFENHRPGSGVIKEKVRRMAVE